MDKRMEGGGHPLTPPPLQTTFRVCFPYKGGGGGGGGGSLYNITKNVKVVKYMHSTVCCTSKTQPCW